MAFGEHKGIGAAKTNEKTAYVGVCETKKMGAHFRQEPARKMGESGQVD